MRITYEHVLNDPSLLERIERQAHRERAEAVHRLLVAPLKAALAPSPQTKIHPRLGTSSCG